MQDERVLPMRIVKFAVAYRAFLMLLSVVAPAPSHCPHLTILRPVVCPVHAFLPRPFLRRSFYLCVPDPRQYISLQLLGHAVLHDYDTSTPLLYERLTSPTEWCFATRATAMTFDKWDSVHMMRAAGVDVRLPITMVLRVLWQGRSHLQCARPADACRLL